MNALPFVPLLLLCQLVFVPLTHADEVRQRIEQPVEQAIAARQATQIREEQWRQERQELVARLDALQLEVTQLRNTRDEVTEEVAAAEKRISVKELQLDHIRGIEVEMEPFLDQLLLALEQLPETGMPFLLEERGRRIQQLKKTLANPDIETSEKYRKTMEALTIEAEYGLTIETYQQTVDLRGHPLLVNVFRLGRLGLFYLTLDQDGCGFYNIADKVWQPLPDRHIHALQKAMEIGAKRRPAELINMPLGRMVSQ